MSEKNERSETPTRKPDKKIVCGLFNQQWVIKFSFVGDVPITRRDLNQLKTALRVEHSAYLRVLRVEQLKAKRELEQTRQD